MRATGSSPRGEAADDPGAPLEQISFFDPYPHAFGGAQRVIEGLAAEIATRGLDVEVVTVGEGPLTDRLTSRGIPWRTVRLPKSLMVYGHQTRGLRALSAILSLPLTWFRVARHLRRRSVAHVCDLRGMLLFAPAARLAGCRVVWHVNFPERSRPLNRFAAILASTIVAPSQDAKMRLAGVTPSRVEVIPNGIPPEPYEQKAPEFQDPVIVTAARLTPEKGLDILIEALARVLHLVPEARLLIQGSAQQGYESYHRQLQKQIAELGLGSAVSFLGFAEEPWREWRKACLYVQASREESFGLAAAEAMAAALPVVATQVGAIRHMVVDGVTGLLVKPGDADELAGAMVTLLLDRDLARGMGRAGRERVRQQLSFSIMGDRFLDLYRALVR
ncbi:MAG TPA: glycosyltransferase family 4 protein [Acidimicrobiales bacterium]|nr:glycosyltransferase family 4 protein [Acidimicrobiales bacterium]